MPRQNLKVSVAQSNVLEFPCDVLVLKYAQAWHGADQAVAAALGLGRGWDLGGEFVSVGSFKLVNGERKIAADHVLFEGVVPIQQFNYSKVREFSRNALTHLQLAVPNARHVAMTMHGVHTGLDEKESFLSQLAGVLEALSFESLLPNLEQLTFVEKNSGRTERLRKLLNDNYFPPRETVTIMPMSQPVASAGLAAEKPHVFVAMPFVPEMEDVFIFGIQGPVQEAGLLCERVDMDMFSGDIVERIKSRITTSKLVIADLTGANANVYLEVGYAWGTNVKTILLVRNPDELKFDVKGQRCVIYSSINDLKKKLSDELLFHCRK